MDPQEDIKCRKAAITTLTNQQVLVQLAESPSTFNLLRRVAVQKIDDQIAIAHVATHDEDPVVRRFAIQLLTDQQTLAEIAINDIGVSTRTNNQQSGSSNLAWEDLMCRKEAITTLTNQQILAKIAESSGIQYLLRKEAVRKINDQIVLARVATHDEDPVLRQDAIDRLTDQQTLAEIAIHDTGISKRTGHPSDPYNLACDAVARLNDQALLARVAIEAPRKNAKQWVQIQIPAESSGLGGKTGLGAQEDAAMATFDNYRGIRPDGSAIIKTAGYVQEFAPDGRLITNEPQWKWEEQTVFGLAANEAAVAKITDPALLTKVKAEAKESSVRDCAARRLEELSPSKQP
jgi:hypothetical protein